MIEVHILKDGSDKVVKSAYINKYAIKYITSDRECNAIIHFTDNTTLLTKTPIGNVLKRIM